MFASLGNLLDGLLGINVGSEKKETIENLQKELGKQQKQTATYRTLTYLFGVGLLFCAYKIFRK